jgi:peptidoglycan/xylan/chitin deacetylase (PgdA/CDA1 family)
VRSQWLGPTDWRGRDDCGAVALTFDDGPSELTDPLLDRLGELGIKATFFMVGRQVERYPAIARRVAEEGHEIGNHSYSHPIYLYRNQHETWRQLARTQEVISAVTGVRPRLARPPCGVRTPAYFRAANVLGLRTVQWTCTGFDWKRRDAQRIAADAMNGVSAGAIILLHDGDSSGKRDRLQTVKAVPLIVSALESRNLRVAPLIKILENKTRSKTNLDRAHV